jgi:hypothetical protein
MGTYQSSFFSAVVPSDEDCTDIFACFLKMEELVL